MKNLTLKRRFQNETNVRKNDFIQSITGKKFEEICESTVPIQIGSRYDRGFIDLKDHIESKPKEFSLRTWLFPVLFANQERLFITGTDGILRSGEKVTPERAYQLCKEWNDNKTKKVIVEVSGKLQHLAMCFDSKHFTTCGSKGGGNYDVATAKIQRKNVFCVFLRDRSGSMLSRTILMDYTDHIAVYNCYGDSTYHTALMSSIEKIKGNKKIVKKHSFL